MKICAADAYLPNANLYFVLGRWPGCIYLSEREFTGL
jgi:hypothetical protein